jgi:hypothetical protein
MQAITARSPYGRPGCWPSQFSLHTWFSSATFAQRAAFGQATFADVTFQGVTFGGATNFAGATFPDNSDWLPFKDTRVLVSSAQDVWPAGWCLMPNRRGQYLLARTKGAK